MAGICAGFESDWRLEHYPLLGLSLIFQVGREMKKKNAGVYIICLGRSGEG